MAEGTWVSPPPEVVLRCAPHDATPGPHHDRRCSLWQMPEPRPRRPRYVDFTPRGRCAVDSVSVEIPAGASFDEARQAVVRSWRGHPDAYSPPGGWTVRCDDWPGLERVVALDLGLRPTHRGAHRKEQP